MRPLKKALSIFHFLDFFFFMIWIDSISFDIPTNGIKPPSSDGRYF